MYKAVPHTHIQPQLLNANYLMNIEVYLNEPAD